MAEGEGAPFAALVRDTGVDRLLVLQSDCPNTLGRSSGRAKLVVKSEKYPSMVSRLHATVELREGRWLVTDNSTTNGTSVDGVVVSTAELKNGARLLFGGAVGRKEGERLLAPATDVAFTFFTDEAQARAVASSPPLAHAPQAAAGDASAPGLDRSATAEDLQPQAGGALLGKRSASDGHEGAAKQPRLGESTATMPQFAANALSSLAGQVKVLQARLQEANTEIVAAERSEQAAREEAAASKETVAQLKGQLAILKAHLRGAAEKALAEKRKAASERQHFTSELVAAKGALMHGKQDSLKEAEEVRKAAKCSICVDVFLSPYTLACGCSFCEVCLHTALRTKLSCPLCQAVIFRLPTRSRALATVATVVEPKNLRDRTKNNTTAMASSLKVLQSHLAQAKQRGCTFLNISTRDWTQQDISKFDSGIRLYHGPCKKEYLETIGFTLQRMLDLSPVDLLRAAVNLGLRTPQWQASLAQAPKALQTKMAKVVKFELTELLESPFFVTPRLGGVL